MCTFLRAIQFSVRVMPDGGYWTSDGGGGSFVPQFSMCTVDCVRTDYKLFCATDVVVETVLARRSEVVLTSGVDVFNANSFCDKLSSDLSY